jgi:hypothetical protein
MNPTNVVVAVVVVAAAVAVATVLRRRQQVAPPTQAGGFRAPAQVDRGDFDRPDAPWLVAVFSSATCHTCADVARKAAVLASDDVAVQDVEYGAATELHRRYAIEAVPIVVVADRDGVVHKAFAGPVTATDLWAAVAEARQPGTTPEPGLGDDGRSG